MTRLRTTRVPDDNSDDINDGSAADRKALWVIRELGLPTVVKTCVACRTTRHHPTGRFRVNANGKIADVWLLLGCEACGRTSKLPVHERVRVKAIERERRMKFELNDPAAVRELVLDPAMADRAEFRLDWAGTWELETDLPFYRLDGEDAASLEVVVRFELPVPVRIEKLVMAGFGLSRSAVRDMVDSGRIRLPPALAVDAEAREDFTFSVVRPG